MEKQRSYTWPEFFVPLWLGAFVFVAVPDASCALDIYVAVDGGPQADGSLTKPYGSLPDAVNAVRALRTAGNLEPVVIRLRAGRHQLDQTLVLGIKDGSPETSGEVALPKHGAGDTIEPASLTFAGFPGEDPVVSGGVPVLGWKRLESAPAELPAKATGKVWVADMPKSLEKFHTLYDTQGRLKRARGDGFLPTKNGGSRTLHFPEGALRDWDNLEDVEIQVRPGRAWVINMLPLASVNEAEGVAQTSVSATYSIGALPAYLLQIMGDSAASVWVENVLEHLDAPGEWVVNTTARKIYLWPSDPAPDGSPRGILAPSATELIRVEGDIDYEGPTDKPVRGIAFTGLTFSHADRWAWASDEGRLGWGMQHDWDMFDRPTALLRFRGAPVTGSKVQRNIIVAHPDGGLAQSERMRKGQTSAGPKLESIDMDKNVYFHPTNPHWMDEHLLKMRTVGKEKASHFGDPMFVDPANGDFSFRLGSPAMALGIEPLDVSKMGRLNDQSLQISDGSRFVPKDFYPKFSWDTTPLYYMFGDRNRVLRPEQVRFIAKRTGFLCIEKSHGMGELGTAELGAKHEAAAFKEIKPGVKVLFYFNAAYAWPYTSYNRDFTRQRIEAHPQLKKFLITHPKTGRLADRYGAFCFDVLKADFRNWWVETVAKGVEESGCDGAFIDQMHGSVKLRPGKGPEIEKAMGQMMAALKQRLGADKILLANNAYNADAKHVYPVSDAVMFENYATVKSSKESLLAEWEHMLKNAKDGKISVFRLGVEGTGRRNLKPNMPKLSQEKAEFALACYLIGAQPYSYFMYSWGWKLSSGALVDYPEFRRPLGPPKGAYKRTTPDGWEFTREFEHASVWVNTESRQARITWR